MKTINFENFKVIINQRYDCFITDIWCIEARNTGDVYFNIENNILIEKIFPIYSVFEISEAKPFLSLSTRFAEIFIKSLVEYANNINIKTKDQSLIEGKLIATEKHLEDVREYTKKLLNFITIK